MADPSLDRISLRTAGWSDARIRAATRRRDLVTVTRGSLLPASVAEEHFARCAAALRSQRADAAVSHRAAAALHGFRCVPATWSLSDEPVDVTAARDDLTRSSRHGLRRRLADLPDADVTVIDGLRVTSPARTLVDLARTEVHLLAMQFTDAALTDARCTSADLVAVCDRMVRVPNVTRARKVAALARPGVDSPQETLVRLQVIDARLPEPSTRLEIVEDGRLLAVGDLGYWQWLIWMEYDGYDFHSGRGVFATDRSRDRWLARRGWEVLRLHADDTARPTAYLRQLEAAIREAPARLAAMDPQRSPELTAAQHLLATRRS